MLVQPHCVFLRKPLRSNAASFARASRMLRLALIQPDPWRRTDGRTGGAESPRAAAAGSDRPSSCSSAWRRRRTPATRRSAANGTASLPPILRASTWSSDGAAGPFEVKRRASHQGAQRLRMAVAAVGIVEPAEHEDVVSSTARSESGTASCRSPRRSLIGIQ